MEDMARRHDDAAIAKPCIYREALRDLAMAMDNQESFDVLVPLLGKTQGPRKH